MGRNSSGNTSSSPKRKRKASSTAVNNNMWPSSSSKKKRSSATSGSGNIAQYGIDETEAGLIFQQIQDEEDPTVATMEGISKLCDLLEIDPYDTRILVLMWKMGANSKPAQISNEEFMKGCAKLQVDSIKKIQNILPSLDTGFLDQSEFRDFYKFCFQFNRQGTHKTLDKDLVVQLLQLVLTNRISEHRLTSFCEFVTKQTSYTRITLDQWCSFLDFCYECDEDLSNYDQDSSAWPVLIDDYVEFVQESHK